MGRIFQAAVDQGDYSGEGKGGQLADLALHWRALHAVTLTSTHVSIPGVCSGICIHRACLHCSHWPPHRPHSLLCVCLPPAVQWAGFIKDYDGGTLMECRIHHSLPYADFPGEFVLARSGISGSVASHTITLISQIDLVGAPAN